MGNIMNRYINILLIFLLLTMNLSAQIVYDTIPDDDKVISCFSYDELFVFKDFNNQAFAYFNKIDFENLDCYGEKVFVKTIFGKNGELKNTRIIKSASPICDSIVFNFVNGLKNWLPGLLRGKYVDIPFIFPITIDSSKINDKYLKYDMFFNVSDEEYFKKKVNFDFFYSNEYNQKIINDFDFFKNYIAEIFRDSQYVHVLTDYKLKRKESVFFEFNIPKSKYTHLLLRNFSKDWILYEYNLKKGKVRVPRNKKLFLILYLEGDIPLIQTMMIYSEKDTTINVKLEEYTKGRLLDEIKKYSP